MIYCGIHQADHTPAEFAECLKGTPPPSPPPTPEGER